MKKVLLTLALLASFTCNAESFGLGSGERAWILPQGGYHIVPGVGYDELFADAEVVISRETVPIITGISVGAIGNSTATIGWTTDLVATSEVEYGLTTAYDLSVLDLNPVTDHSMPLINLLQGTLYHYRVRSINAFGLETISADGTFTTTAPVGVLSGAVTTATTTVNLTTEGPGDWVHWGDAQLNRKTGVTSQIPQYVQVGNTAPIIYGNDLRGLTWTDGTPTATGTANKNGLYIEGGTGKGFQLTVPADTASRTFVVHVAGWNSSGTMTAHLSDGSVADYSNTTTFASGQYDRNYTFTYQATSAGQSLVVKWLQATSSGNVTLNGAALTGSSPPPPPPPPPPGEFHAPGPTNSLVVSVLSTGATANDGSDDTSAIQSAVNQVAGTGGTVLVPAGNYWINALTSINLGSSMTFQLESGATLSALPNGSDTYAVVRADNKSNLNIVGVGGTGSTIKGERHSHTVPGDHVNGQNGQWGMCIRMGGGSNNYVDGIQTRECWGDGIYVVGNSTNFNVFNVVADDNRRQGMSIIDVDGMVVRDSIFENTSGTNPQHGIDIEPNAGLSVNNVQILNSQFINNHFRGIETYAGASGVTVTNITIDGNTFTGNQQGIQVVSSGNQIIRNNTITGTYGIGFNTSTGNQVSNNVINWTAACISGGAGNTLTNNTCNP